MKTRFSTNPKTNRVMKKIAYQLLHIHDTEEESIKEIKHYMNEFPEQTDYNIYQYGNVLIYWSDIYELYRKSGYKKSTIPNCYIAEKYYKAHIRFVAQKLVKNL